MHHNGYRKGPGRDRLVIIFLCVAVLFAAIWGTFELFGRYYQPAPAPPPEPPAPVEMPNPLMNEILPGMPVSQFQEEQFRWQDGFLAYSGQENALRGVDVSDHQGVIDWAQVAADGVEFAMLRVAYRGYTEGAITMDQYFQENAAGALKNGIAVGAYFFSQAVSEEEARQEAQVVLDAVAGLDITFPLVFDWEEIPHTEARTDAVDNRTLTACAKAFCQTVEDAGYTAGVYFNQKFGYQHFNLLELKSYVLWLAEYQDAPTFYYDFDLWQYSASGTVAGIETEVDLNLSFWQP